MTEHKTNVMHVGCSELGVAASLIYAGFNILEIDRSGEHNCFVFEDTPASRLVIDEHEENEFLVPSLCYHDIVSMLAIRVLEPSKDKDE